MLNLLDNNNKDKDDDEIKNVYNRNVIKATKDDSYDSNIALTMINVVYTSVQITITARSNTDDKNI